MATPIEPTEAGPKRISSPKKEGIFDSIFNIDYFTGGELPVMWVKRIAFVAFLTLINIYYSMLADGKLHQIQKEKSALEEDRADYTTQKAEYMKVSKQTNLEETLKRYQIGVSTLPPTKIIIQVNKEQ
ncbi:FtsL-like putative cell division protein [Aquirufa lenticrescens]|jgi:hypothetical protein|uniref:FtsL-like putative cell division protein n=1 Tax=Aquirufa lenticrescens TaxID=2696560 RepID=UPI001CAA4B40|nr:FtsL-like putative cell division protein [Aquirufa lenticrescens]UAJ13327.1 hypothetical protein G9X62_01760 [Aquirufa lenticrescens]